METKKQLLNSSLKQDNILLHSMLNKAAKIGRGVLPLLCCVLLSQPVYSAVNQAKVRQLQQKLIDNPRDVDAHLKLALEYSMGNDFVKAVETYFALLRIDPNNFHAYNNLGILYKQSGQFRDSLHCYQQAQRIDPDSCWVPYNMGLCYEAMGRMQEARESYGQALSLNPSFSQALQRLRVLSSDGADQPVPELPGLAESQIYIADSRSTRPVIRTQQSETTTVAKAVKQQPSPTAKPVEKIEKAERISERLEKEKNQKKVNLKHRTTRKGPAAMVFNQAMDALEAGKTELAVELYVNSVIAERELLSEPENGLIRQGLTYLKDRPNRMANGLFYRGMLIYIAGHIELAIPDLKNYSEVVSKSDKASSVSQYLEEANRIINRYKAEKDAIAAMEAERKAAIALAEQQKKAQEAAVKPEEEVARPSDFALKRMDIDQIIQEADKLSRESRLTDAAAVLESGLSRDPENIPLLMKSANAYTDMLLLKGDNEAGKMALVRYKKVTGLASPNSKEAAIAKEMIDELNKRVR